MYLANCRKKLVLLVVCLYHLPQISRATQVFVVTPSSSKPQINEGRSAPFYYHNWMRRMDTMTNSTTSTTTTTTRKPNVETPDLIFAEFESENNDDDMKKSLRKLLQRERVAGKSSTMAPIVVDERQVEKSAPNKVIVRPIVGGEDRSKEDMSEHSNSLADYYAMLKNVYDSAPSPVYVPSTTPSTTVSTSTTTSTTASAPMDVQNIWHIIDSEKTNQYSGTWEEAPIETDVKNQEDSKTNDMDDANAGIINENFALPGFNTSPGNAGENESRAIRTEPNFRFPYVNLKTFQLKNVRKPVVTNKKGASNLYTSLDSFREINYPVRGEAQDVVPMQPPIDRYNPAQPYLPSEYGSKSKQTSSIPSGPVKTMANLVPPPPPKSRPGDSLPPPTSYESFPPYPQSFSAVSQPRPPSPPKTSSDDFLPPPSSYESFPPYPQSFSEDSPSDSLPSIPRPVPPMPPSMQPPKSMSQPVAPDDDSVPGPPSSDSDSDTEPGYNYDMPPQFLPTPPPDSDKPFTGYSYKKPMKNEDSGVMDMGRKPEFTGYHYNKPPPPAEHPIPHSDHDYPSHDYHGPLSYNPPPPPPSPSDTHDSDYPELIFDKHHGDSDDSKGGDDSMKGGDMTGSGNGGGMDMNGDDMGMPPPPPPPDMDNMKPDHDFSQDFHGDFKYHDDFDDHYHDYHHHHHHTTTTTTTTTEMPRVNRYSYYYLGKKLYYLPLYFSVYFIVYVGALIIKAVLRHKIVYPNSWRPNDITASFFSKRSVDGNSWDLSGEKLHDLTRFVAECISGAAEKYMRNKKK